MNPWDNFWQLFFPLPGAPSPRERLFRYVLEDLLQPKQLDLYTQQYFTVLSFFATILGPFLAVGFLVGLYQTITQRSLRPLKQWLASAVYVLGILAAVPGILTGFQYFLSIVGSSLLDTMLGTDKLDEIVKFLLALTGDVNIDAGLGFIQLIFLLLLAVELKLVLVALYASAVVLMIGLTLRFLPWVGEPLFLAGLKISIFGVSGYLNVMVTMSLVIGGGQMIVGNNAWGMGFLNVAAIGVSVWVLWHSLSSLANGVKEVWNGAVEGYHKMRDSSPFRGWAGRDSVDKGAQTAADAADHLKGARHGNGEVGASATTSKEAGPAHTKVATQLAKEKVGSGKPTPASPPRASSTAARLARGAASKIPAPQVQAALVAVDTAEKVGAGAAALRGVTANKPGSGESTRPAQPGMERSTPPKSESSGSGRRLAPPTPADVTASTYQQRHRLPPEPQPLPRNRESERRHDK